MVLFRRLLVGLMVSGGLMAVLPACTTEDIDPVIGIRVDSLQGQRVREDSGVAYVTASLNGAAKKDVRLTLSFGGTAQQGFDYTVSATQVTIPAGQLTATVTVTALPDALVEGDETLVVRFSAPENASLLGADSALIIISDADADTDGDGIADAADLCPTEPGTAANGGCPAGFGLIFNEVLYDPSDVGLEGDANHDGVYNQEQDSFVEIYNNTSVAQSLAGYTVWDAQAAQFTFPTGAAVPPHKAVVVFGGGTPTGAFGGSTVYTATGTNGLSMGNTGDKVVLKDDQGNTVQTFDSDALSNNPNESYTRSPDITGDFVQHGSIVPASGLFSPGTRTDGRPF